MHHPDDFEHIRKELDFLKVLVVRFGEQKRIAGLELDIALTKTQEIYEYLLKLKLAPGVEKPETGVSTAEKATKPAPVEVKIEVEQTAPAEIPDRSIPESAVAGTPEVEAAKPDISEKKDKPAKSTAKPLRTDTILAEKIHTGTHQPINEVLAQQKAKVDLADKWQTKPLDAIASGIGLNERFLYIRELFAGDGTLYSDTVRRLDTAASLNDALDFIDANFDWDKEDETALKFIHLIHRRHGS